MLIKFGLILWGKNIKCSGKYVDLRMMLYSGKGALTVRAKPPGHEPDHSPPSNTGVKEWVELYFHSHSTPSWRDAQLKVQGHLYLLTPYRVCTLLGYTRHLVLLGQWNIGGGWLATHVARMKETRNAYRILVGKSLGKQVIRRLKGRTKDNIKTDLGEKKWLWWWKWQFVFQNPATCSSRF